MLRLGWLLVALAGCGQPTPTPAQVRVINLLKGSRSLDVAVRGEEHALRLRPGEASVFEALDAGPAEVALTDSVTGEALGRLRLDAPASQALSVVVAAPADGVQGYGVVHRFAAPRDGFIRARVLNAVRTEAGPLVVGDRSFSALGPGDDTGPEGIELPAGRPSGLSVFIDGARLSFRVPALPDRSELLLVLSRSASGQDITMLGVAPSAALGFFEPVPGVP
ncbi:MAG: DUF4397 domain-containing protein [Myxococcaceae bacterium]|jgi:hypothetical protein|nr:DUF4397 domain-containing protein [Myxococcaceae bacterium]